MELKKRKKDQRKESEKLRDAFTTPDIRTSSQSTQQEVSMAWKKK